MSANFQPIVDELTYVNYACNRDAAPHVAPEQWARCGYPNVPAMEARYQAEQAITRAKVSSQEGL